MVTSALALPLARRHSAETHLGSAVALGPPERHRDVGQIPGELTGPWEPGAEMRWPWRWLEWRALGTVGWTPREAPA